MQASISYLSEGHETAPRVPDSAAVDDGVRFSSDTVPVASHAVALAGMAGLIQRYVRDDAIRIGVLIETPNVRHARDGLLHFDAEFSADPTLATVSDDARRLLRRHIDGDIAALRFILSSHPPQRQTLSRALKVLDDTIDVDDCHIAVRAVALADGAVRCCFTSSSIGTATLDRLSRAFEVLIRDGEARPTMPITALDVLTVTERRALLQEWQGTAAGYPAVGLSDLIDQRIAVCPKQIALKDGERSVSFGELGASIAAMCRRLGGSVAAGDYVGICADASPESIAAILAILRLGGAYVPLDPTHPSDYLNDIVNDCGIDLVIASPDARDRFENLNVTVLDLAPDRNGARAQAERVDYPPQTPDDVAYLIYTSGTTGKPKGVIGTHASVLNGLNMLPFSTEAGSADVCSLNSPLSLGISLSRVFLPLLCGVPIVIVPREDWADVRRLVAIWTDEHVTSAVLATPLLRQLIAMPPTQLAGLDLRTFIVGGAAVPAEWAIEFRRLFPKTTLLIGYASSEAGGAALFRAVDDGASIGKTPSSIGRPFPNTKVYILDRWLKPVPVGVEGELCISARHLSRGYVGLPELTRAKFQPNPHAPGERIYRTGDLCRWLANGEIDYIGRVDDQLKIRGVRIEPGQVESVLRQLDRVADAAVSGHDYDGEKRLIAFIVANGAPPNPTELRAQLSSRLPQHMVPAAFVLVDALPYTSQGKLDRARLSSLPVCPMSARDTTEAGNDIETVVKDLWEAELATKPVGIHDDFLDAGGDSLAAVIILSKLSEQFGIDLPITALFEHPTVAELAQHIQGEIDRRP